MHACGLEVGNTARDDGYGVGDSCRSNKRVPITAGSGTCGAAQQARPPAINISPSMPEPPCRPSKPLKWRPERCPVSQLAGYPF